MERELEQMAADDVLRRFDEVRDVRVQADYRDETYKHVMMPVYTTAYTYKGKRYHVLINGQSGRVEGDYPKSPAKIGAIAAAVLIIIALVYWFSQSGEERGYAGVHEPQAAEARVDAAWLTEAEIEEENWWVYSEDSLPT